MEFFQDFVPASTSLPSPDPLRRGKNQLNRDDILFSRLKNFQLRMQADGNLVLYAIDDNAFPDFKYVDPRWESGTNGSGAVRCNMENDGNLVLYDADGIPHWSSGTEGNPGAFLRCQDDGNLVIFASNGEVVWSSGTFAAARDGGFPNGGVPPGPLQAWYRRRLVAKVTDTLLTRKTQPPPAL
jgi:hypothetical protein